MAPRERLAKYIAGFVCGVTVGTGGCIAAVKLYMPDQRPEERPEENESAARRMVERYGLPLSGADSRFYTNHVLSYDQARRTPRWVAEHLSNQKLFGRADRKHCKFKPDPSIPELFTAHNDDYLGSGWSRGHMAPAADSKFSEKSMAETFYLSNIVPQNYENNGGFWNRLEMYCRELTERFSDVWVISGPLTLPQVHQDGKRMVSYQLIGKDDVAVPTHLYKVILVQKDPSAEPMALGAFVVPNAPIGFEHHLKEYQVSLTDLERMSGLIFFPEIEKSKDLKNLCLVDTCELMDFKRFTLYISSRKVASARTLARLEKIMSELEDAEITPDNYLATLYQEKKQELLKKESPQSQSE
ncbi:nuclease EXOG, mitochondrial isoform X1 [Brachyhypopomus gauderio]|uniref:nuclease EXOG, mitochondrial isoform X1 n=1 Tax=Brachyhypopomus gauderio TaxID=698409 RepID=UPI00404318DC